MSKKSINEQQIYQFSSHQSCHSHLHNFIGMHESQIDWNNGKWMQSALIKKRKWLKIDSPYELNLIIMPIKTVTNIYFQISILLGFLYLQRWEKLWGQLEWEAERDAALCNGDEDECDDGKKDVLRIRDRGALCRFEVDKLL